ncbi:MAG TPA: MFS transporter [Candidatus Saccharimonadales bacterium]|nr:MFS transporter [Candidatus Saccharimonadales bacterium]
MNPESSKVQRTYLTLVLLNTLAASLIWGINTIFLLDAGLSNLEAFAANAFFTVGMVLFEIPTGIVADLKGRRASFMLGTVTLAVSTLLYVWLWQAGAPFWAWAIVSAFLGLGFTFFSGATEAWLVDALHATKYKGKLEAVFAKGQIVGGIATFGGAVGGGILAQATNLGVPYLLRGIILVVSFFVAFTLMRDMGFTPVTGKRPLRVVKDILDNSIKHGLGNPPVRWVMLTGPFVAGVSIYGFYALQPYLLELWGDEKAYALAGVTAAILAAAQVAGGLLAPYFGRVFQRRTTILFTGTLLSAGIIALMGLIPHFWPVVVLVVLWGLLFAATTPVRQAYINSLILANQRATVLSFDSLLSSAGGVVVQPILGRAADVWSYPASYVLGGAIHMLALPFAWKARRSATTTKAAQDADTISPDENAAKPDN